MTDLERIADLEERLRTKEAVTRQLVRLIEMLDHELETLKRANPQRTS